jgi:hypothetical protein
MPIRDFSARLGTGEERRLVDYRGKVLLIVNVASKCGFTPQYSGLQSLYEQLQPRGFEILAFPCDQFGHQEPGSDAEIATFCDATYPRGIRVAFKLLDKTWVSECFRKVAVYLLHDFRWGLDRRKNAYTQQLAAGRPIARRRACWLRRRGSSEISCNAGGPAVSS